MSIFKKKDGNAPARSRGLGRSVSAPTQNSEADDGVTIEAARDLSDEIMEADRADRSTIDDNLFDDAFEDDAVARPKSKGLFGKEKAPASKKSGKAPAGKTKKLSRKQIKSRKENEEAIELTTRLSVLVEIEELPGVSKLDAIETARHQALNHSDRPSNCYFNVLETRKGYLIEVQEGVGRSYLPSVHKLAIDNPGRIVVVPMVRRKLTVIYSPRTDTFDTQILGEDIEPPMINGEPLLYALRGPVMTPIFKQYQQWFIAGIITAAIGGVALLSSLAFYALDPAAKVPPEWRTTPVGQLPIMQWRTLQSGTADTFVARLEYTDGKWQAIRQNNFASLEVNDVGDQQSATVVGGNVSGPASPDGLPGTVPPAGQPAPQNMPMQPGPANNINPAPPAGMNQP